jgi:hypothetical protein
MELLGRGKILVPFTHKFFLVSGSCNLVVFAVRCLMFGFCSCHWIFYYLTGQQLTCSVMLLFSFFTDTLILPELNGPTEGLMVIYLAQFFTAIVGN